MAEFTESNSGLLSPLLVETRPAEELGIDVDSLSRFVDATGPLAVVDLETTGLSEDPAAEILEFGAVLIEPGVRSITTVESLLRPRLPLPLTISHLTGLTDADVMRPRRQSTRSPSGSRSVLEGRTLIAHNADFERSFLTRFVSTALSEYRYLDTQDFLAISHPDSPDLRLETFARAMLNREERHRALSDALDTVCVMSAAAVGVAAGERRYAVARSALESYAPESPWLPLFCGDAPLAAEDSQQPICREFCRPPRSPSPSTKTRSSRLCPMSIAAGAIFRTIGCASSNSNSRGTSCAISMHGWPAVARGWNRSRKIARVSGGCDSLRDGARRGWCSRPGRRYRRKHQAAAGSVAQQGHPRGRGDVRLSGSQGDVDQGSRELRLLSPCRGGARRRA